MEAGRSGWLGSRFWAWANGWFQPRHLSAVVSTDADRVAATLAAHDPGRRPAVEPEVRGDAAGFLDRRRARAVRSRHRRPHRRLAPSSRQRPRSSASQRRAAQSFSPFDRRRRSPAHRPRRPTGQLGPSVAAGDAGAHDSFVPTLWSWVRSQPTASGLQLDHRRADGAWRGSPGSCPNAGPGPANTRFVRPGRGDPGGGGRHQRPDLLRSGRRHLHRPGVVRGRLPDGPQDPPLASPLRAVAPRVPRRTWCPSWASRRSSAPSPRPTPPASPESPTSIASPTSCGAG